MAKSLKQIAHDHIKVPALFSDVLDEVLKPALDGLVQKSETPIDDAIVAALYPALSKGLKEEVGKLWEKLMAEEAVQPVPGPA